MKPIIILPPDIMKDDAIAMLQENGLCVVVATDPSKVRFVDSIPAITSRTQIENAAIGLSRKVLTGKVFGSEYNNKFAEAFVSILIEGTELDPKKEQSAALFDNEKRMEIQRLAREEAKAERLAAKAKTPSK